MGTQGTTSVPGAVEAMDYFGSDVLLSDVTGDGHADLTVTAGFEDEGGHKDMWFAARDIAFEHPVDDGAVPAGTAPLRLTKPPGVMPG